MERFEDLVVWQKARKLASTVYELSSKGSWSRDFEFRGQIRRSSVSIMSNIAEGFERDGNNELRQMLSIAKGSSRELRSQLFVALDRGYLDQDQFDQLLAHIQFISRMLSNFGCYLKESTLRGRKFPTGTSSN